MVKDFLLGTEVFFVVLIDSRVSGVCSAQAGSQIVIQ